MNLCRLFLLFFLFSGMLFAQWYWSNPLPQGNNINDIRFINQTTGWAVGDYGTLLKTTDSGQTWQHLSTGINTNIRRISFPDSSVGYMLCSNGEIYKSANGGTSWHIISSPPDSMTCIGFFSPDTGITAGINGSLYQTIDGGETWNKIPTGISNLNFTDVCFNKRTGLLTGNGFILKTSDGGSSWTQKLSWDKYLFSAEFVDDSFAVATGVEHFFRSTDAGETWNSIFTDWNSHMYSIHFFDRYTGIASGYDFESDGFISEIRRTTDGGNTWTTIYFSAGYDFNYLTAGTSNSVVVVGRDNLFRYSSDRGNSWNSLFSGWLGNLNRITFSDEQHILAVGGNGGILYSTDGGLNWGRWTSFPALSLRDVSASGNFAAAVGPGVITVSSNFGAVWQTLNRDPALHMYGCCVIDSLTIIAVGENGLVLRTTTGGASWDSLHINGENHNLMDVTFANASTGIAVSDTGHIFKTTDQGITWFPLNSVTISALYSIFSVDENVWYTVGQFGTINKTTDGGANWFCQYPGTTAALTGVSFINEQHGTVTGGRKILSTTDGGSTWQEYPPPSASTYTDVVHVSDNLAFLVGTNGNIFKSSNGGILFYDDEIIRHKAFSLSQNYPNPFNPATTINYSVSETALITIKIFDLLGREIVQLLNEEKTPGQYQTTWNAANFSSGIYFYRIQSEKYSITKKMMLLK